MTEKAEMKASSSSRIVLELLLTILATYIINKMVVLVFVFLLPLFIFSSRHGKEIGYAAFFGSALTFISTSFLAILGQMDDKVIVALTVFDLYIPLSLLAAGVIWMSARKLDWGSRYFLSLVPAGILYLGFFLWLEHDPALFESIRSAYGNALEYVLSVLLNLEKLDPGVLDKILNVFLMAFLSLVVPSVSVFACANFYLKHRVLHSRENDFEDRIARLELKGYAIWVFLASWAGIFICRFISIPQAVVVALFNVAICISVPYVAQGFSVVFYHLRKKGSRMGSLNLLILLAALLMIAQGINIILILGLLVIGVLESFFELRR